MTPKGPPRMREVTRADVVARAQVARKFLEVALLVQEDTSEPAYRQVSASLAVLAGIAASDAICGSVLGAHPQGRDHNEAVDVLSSIRTAKPAAVALGRLLAQKGNAHYGTTVSADLMESMLGNARRLIDSMEEHLAR